MTHKKTEIAKKLKSLPDLLGVINAYYNCSTGLDITTSPTRADERIVNYLKGLNYLDDRLTNLLMPLQGIDGKGQLPPSQQAMVATILQHLKQASPTQLLPVIQLLGTDKQSKQLIAWHTAATLGVHLYRLPVGLLPTQITELETFIRLWQRESLLLPIALTRSL